MRSAGISDAKLTLLFFLLAFSWALLQLKKQPF